MPQIVVPVRDNDVQRLIDIEFAAYAQNPDAILLRGRDANNQEHKNRAQLRYDHLLGLGPETWFRKVVDTDLPNATNDPGLHTDHTIEPDEKFTAGSGATIGWMRWENARHGINMNESLYSRFDQFPWPMAQHEWTLARRYWCISECMRRIIMFDRPHVYICLIVVHPDHQRRGAASKLFETMCGVTDSRFGLDADENYMPAYLEASRGGRRLYHRYGFRVTAISIINLPGMTSERTSYLMVRDPRVLPEPRVPPDQEVLSDRPPEIVDTPMMVSSKPDLSVSLNERPVAGADRVPNGMRKGGLNGTTDGQHTDDRPPDNDDSTPSDSEGGRLVKVFLNGVFNRDEFDEYA